MVGFREGESRSPTPKPALIFNWIETTKRAVVLYVGIEIRNKHLGRIMKFYPVVNVLYQ